MATNFFFNNFKSSQEQVLLESLIIEAIRIYGEDMYYIPRNLGNYDPLLTADDSSTYTQAFMVELYIKSVNGFSGDGNFMSKFGLEIRDQVVFSVAQRVFNDEIGAYTTITRPREGDLVFFPLNNKCFQIKYVNKFEMFYQLGALQTWELTCELFEYNQEKFTTGVATIDNAYNALSLVEENYQLLSSANNVISTEDGGFLVLESYIVDVLDNQAQNEIFDQEALDFLDFTERDPFSEGTRF